MSRRRRPVQPNVPSLLHRVQDDRAEDAVEVVRRRRRRLACDFIEHASPRASRPSRRGRTRTAPCRRSRAHEDGCGASSSPCLTRVRRRPIAASKHHPAQHAPLPLIPRLRREAFAWPPTGPGQVAPEPLSGDPLHQHEGIPGDRRARRRLPSATRSERRFGTRAGAPTPASSAPAAPSGGPAPAARTWR